MKQNSILPAGGIWAIEQNAYNRLRSASAALSGVKIEAAAPSEPYQIMNKVAVIRIRGIMDKLPNLFLTLFGGTSTATARRAVERAAADSAVAAILLAIDSPGGSVDGIAELGDAVYAARQSKRVVAQVDGMAASAAYYVASQTEAIYAHRMDMVGSIGTIMMMYDWHEFYEKEGIEAVPIATGKYKAAGAEGTEITEAQRADFQRIVDAYYKDFLSMVSRGRGMTATQVKELADGRVFMPGESIANGLIDGIQTFEQTLAAVTPKSSAAKNYQADVKIRLSERA